MPQKTDAVASPTAPRLGAGLYDAVAEATAALVLKEYSSSFGLACTLLHQPVRRYVRNVYALVRLADEIVDGAFGVTRPARALALLDRLEAEVNDALTDGYSANLVVHAFAATAATYGIGVDLVAPFFASMRDDVPRQADVDADAHTNIDPTRREGRPAVQTYDRERFERYVYGSAEVVGLMCLRVFLGADGRAGDYDALAPGARRLGSAFQKVNFLRDLAEDYGERHRAYFPGIDPPHLTDAQKHALLDDIDADLAAARTALAQLPASSRTAVAVAEAVFAALSARLRVTPAATLTCSRVRVSSAAKLRIALGVTIGQRLPSSRPTAAGPPTRRFPPRMSL